MKNTDQ